MFGFIISIGAGYLTPYLEQPLAKPVAAAVDKWIHIKDVEITLLAFMFAMIIAALFCAFFNTGGALGILVGGGLGYFGSRIVAAIKKVIENRNSD